MKELKTTTRMVNDIAKMVETGWAELSEEDKKGIEDIVRKTYYVSNPAKLVFTALQLAFCMVWDKEAVYEYMAAIRRLRDAVLTAVANEPPSGCWM